MYSWRIATEVTRKRERHDLDHKKLCVCVLVSALSWPTLCNPTACSPPGSSAHGILQARMMEWVAISSSRASSQYRDQTHVSCVSYTGRWVLYQRSHWGSPPFHNKNFLNFSLEQWRATEKCWARKRQDHIWMLEKFLW